MKFDYLALILTFLLGILILVSPPFVASAYVPGLIRIPLLFIGFLFFLLLVIKQRKFVYKLVPFIGFFIFEIMYWVVSGKSLDGETAYFLIYIILALSLSQSGNRIKGWRFLICNFYFLLVLSFSLLAILSFLAYNLDLLPYTLKPVGDDGYYTNFHNPLLGYISVRQFESGNLGRVCGYLFEPSYLGWFLTVNFFLLNKYVKDPAKLLLSRILVFFGAMATCSSMAWAVFPVVFLIAIFYMILEKINIKGRLANIILISTLSFGVLCFVVLIPKQYLVDKMGASSADDREDRVGASFLIIANSSIPDLLMGKGPGYIVKTVQKGESNQLIKTFVETGLFSTILILIFIVNCTKKSKYFMIANLLFLNSVVILFTPLFIINLLVCKWYDES